MTSQHDIPALPMGRSGGQGLIVGIVVTAAIAIVALVIGFWYFALGPGQGTFGGSSDADELASS